MMKTIVAVSNGVVAESAIFAPLNARGYRIVSTNGTKTLGTLLEKQDVDLVLIDGRAGDDENLELLHRVRSQRPDVPAVILSAEGSVVDAVQAVKQGACTYVDMSIDMETILEQITTCLGADIPRHPPSRQGETAAAPSCSRIIADSTEMKEVVAKVVKVADSEASVYLEGESGTGKELVARCLHAASRRKNGPFIVINCAAIPEHLLESELLGYERGAFTGADGRRDGLFTKAHGGSFFLDEIAEMPLAMQAKLLRIIEQREFFPLGSNRTVNVDVRIIAASNRNLENLVEQGLFREDLYYRIRVIPILLPPLRQRRADILPLANHFLATFSAAAGKTVTGFASAVARRLTTADWPGNVRELENVVEYLVAMTDGPLITEACLAEILAEQPAIAPLRSARDRFEKDYLRHLLQASRGNVSRAAKTAGKYRADLYELLRKHRLDPTKFRPHRIEEP